MAVIVPGRTDRLLDEVSGRSSTRRLQTWWSCSQTSSIPSRPRIAHPLQSVGVVGRLGTDRIQESGRGHVLWLVVVLVFGRLVVNWAVACRSDGADHVLDCGKVRLEGFGGLLVLDVALVILVEERAGIDTGQQVFQQVDRRPGGVQRCGADFGDQSFQRVLVVDPFGLLDGL